MPDYKIFEQFARDLYLNATEIEFDARRTVDLDPTAFMRRAETTLMYFSDGHCTKIGRALERCFPQHMTTDEEFMRFVIPKCLNLIDDERYFFSLMLVAAFIQEVQGHQYHHHDVKCYRFALSGYKCLTAIFKRKFEAGFEAHGGFKGLDKYFKSISKAIKNRKKDYSLMMLLNGCDKNLAIRVADLIRNCGTALNQEFLLNDYELSVAEDIEASKEVWFSPPADSVESPFEFDFTLGIAMNDSEMKLKYSYDVGTGEMQSADTEVPDFKLSDYAVSREYPDSDLETSASESSETEEKDCLGSLAFTFFNVTKPDDFDRVVSAHVCGFCKTYCYQYGMYKFKKYSGLALKVNMPRWLRTARNAVLEKLGVFVGRLLIR